MSNYLRNRPFMIVSYTYVLAKGQKSQVPGFMETAKWEPIEKMIISDRVSSKQMNAAEAVLDLFEGKVLKAVGLEVDQHEVLFNNLVTRYYEDVKGALDTWIKKDADNIEKVQAFVDRLAKKKEADADSQSES